MKSFLIVIVLTLKLLPTIAQNTTNIYGVIKGLGTGNKIYLGNKPSGIGSGFTLKIYDSTFSNNDTFSFKNLNFKEFSDLSLETKKTRGWISFLSDTGNIYVRGNADTFYYAKISGSGNNAVKNTFYRELYLPWEKRYNSLNTNFNNLKKLNDSNKTNLYRDTLENLMIKFRKDIINFYKENVKLHPYASFRIFRFYTLETMSDSMLRKYFELLPNNIRKYEEFYDIKYRLSNLKRNISVGKKLPTFTFFLKDDRKITLNSIQGKYKLLSFWASWCGPCLEEIPLLDSLQQIYLKKGLKILTINVDNSNGIWKKNLIKFSLDFTHLYQGSFTYSPIYKYLNIQSIPFLILLDEQNKIIKYDLKIENIGQFIK